MSLLSFLNHASYLIETKDTLLISDPYFEEPCFNRGWALLTNKLSNLEVVNYLKSQNKKLYIWISHEHSDHFSLPFLREIKKSEIIATKKNDIMKAYIKAWSYTFKY